MAWAKVQAAQSAGAANATSVTIAAATAGNTLVSFFSQTGLNAPTCTGFTVESVSAVYNGSLSSVWVATKIAAGGETSVSWTAGSGGTGHGVVAFELSGGPATVTKDGSVVHADNIASGTTGGLAVTTSAANSIILIANGGNTSSGTISAWTGTNVATNVGTAAARCFGGSFITTSTVSSTFTANWSTARASGMIAIALQISAGGTHWTQNPADSTTSTDAVSNHPGVVKADTTTTTDAVSNHPGVAKADSTTSTDAVSKHPGVVGADTTTTTDSVSKHPGVVKADSTTSTDLVAKFVGLFKADSTTSTDNANLNWSGAIVAAAQRIHTIRMGRFGIY